MMDQSKIILETRNLKKHFKTTMGTVHAVDDISIKIAKGQTLGVVGESGCGKSTLGRVVTRLLEPTSGEVIFDGRNILEVKNREMRIFRSEIQMIFQDPFSSLNPRMSIKDIIAEPLRANKLVRGRKELDQRVSSIMEKVGLSESMADVFPHELDGGKRQRVGVARALSVLPKFIVCDEPVSALDVSIQAQILNLLMDIQDEMGLTYMFITHDLSVVKHISDAIMVMYLGQCVEFAEADELFNNPCHPYTKALLSAIPVPSLESRHRKKELIKGEVSSPIDPLPGCRFADRCANCSEGCTSVNIPLVEVGKNHYVSCRKFNNLYQRSEKKA